MKDEIGNNWQQAPLVKPLGNNVVLEIIKTLSSARDLRDGLASLAMAVAAHAGKQGYLLILNAKLNGAFIQDELERFKGVLRSEIAKRVHIVFAVNGCLAPATDGLPLADLEELSHAIANSIKLGTQILPSNKKDEVLLMLMHQWVTGKGNLTFKSLEERVGCNYRTVAHAIDEMAHAVYRHSDRSVSLKYFPQQDWGRLQAVANRTRSVMLYVDESDQPRSYDSLLQRLRRLNLNYVAIGGVLGARRFDGKLDIVGTPRLDLCVHAPDRCVDLEFMHALDPALERTQDTHRPARVVLHFIRRKEALFEQAPDGVLWADPLECLLNLYHARLEQQARSFQEFLMAQAREINGH